MNPALWVLFGKVSEAVARLTKGNLYTAAWHPEHECFEWCVVVNRCCQFYRMTALELERAKTIGGDYGCEVIAEMIAHHLNEWVRLELADRKGKHDKIMRAQKIKETTT